MLRCALALLLVLLAPGALAQATPLGPGLSYLEGGEPGVRVLVGGEDVALADAPRSALRVDPGKPATIALAISPPPGETWDIRGFRVGLSLFGGTPTERTTRESAAPARVPGGYTVLVERTADLSAMENLGSGVFRMHVAVVTTDGRVVDEKSFYVHVEGNALVSAQGVAVTALTVATAYGLWKLLSDLKELYGTWKRHRKQRAHREAAQKSGLLQHARAVLRDKDTMERRGLLRWSATGMGLGAVVLSWAQFLGYLAFDALGLLITGLEMAAAFLVLALFAVAIRRRLLPVVTVPVQAAEAPVAVVEAPPRA